MIMGLANPQNEYLLYYRFYLLYVISGFASKFKLYNFLNFYNNESAYNINI